MRKKIKTGISFDLCATKRKEKAAAGGEGEMGVMDIHCSVDKRSGRGLD